MQSINKRPRVRGPDDQRLAGDASVVNGARGRDFGPPPSPSARLYRPYASSNPPASSRAPPATPGHPPLRSGAASILFRASPSSPRQYPAPSPSVSRPQNRTAAASATTGWSPLPPSLPLFFGAASNQSSASIEPSTAEVRLAPVDGGTAALRELNTNFPSNVYRHLSAKSSGAQSTTYSQPVIVRTYNGPGGGGNRHRNRNNSGSRPVTTRTPLPAPSGDSNDTARSQRPGQTRGKEGKNNSSDASDDGSTKGNGVVKDLWTSSTNLTSKPVMPRHTQPHPPAPKKRGFPLTLLPWQRADRASGDDGASANRAAGGGERPKYPPLEDFTMKGIIQAQRSSQSELDVSLDQIAELYARSRYSLSNQYEVHVTPHGSGLNFTEGAGAASGADGGAGRRHTGSTASGSHRGDNVRRHHQHQLVGPTLQAAWSEDDADESLVGAASAANPGMAAARSSHRKRRSAAGGPGARRKSAAYGTLETIMSSSRSSSEDKEKKKSASRLTEEVRGRAERAAGRNRAKNGGGPGHEADTRQDTATAPAGGNKSPGRTRGHGKTRDQRATEPSNKKKSSAPFAHAVIDNSRSRHETTSPRGSAAALLSEPAMPQTSTGELVSHTMALRIDEAADGRSDRAQRARDRQPWRSNAGGGLSDGGISEPLYGPTDRNGRLKQELATAVALTATEAAVDPRASGGLLAGLNGWMPWRGTATSPTQQQPSPATDGLRDLLKSVDRKTMKGKGVERLG